MALGYYWNAIFLQESFKVCLFKDNLLISMSPPTEALMTQSSSQIMLWVHSVGLVGRVGKSPAALVEQRFVKTAVQKLYTPMES